MQAVGVLACEGCSGGCLEDLKGNSFCYRGRRGFAGSQLSFSFTAFGFRSFGVGIGSLWVYLQLRELEGGFRDDFKYVGGVIFVVFWPEFYLHAPAAGDVMALFLLTPPAQALSCDDGSVGSHAVGHSAEHLS